MVQWAKLMEEICQLRGETQKDRTLIKMSYRDDPLSAHQQNARGLLGKVSNKEKSAIVFVVMKPLKMPSAGSPHKGQTRFSKVFSSFFFK